MPRKKAEQKSKPKARAAGKKKPKKTTKAVKKKPTKKAPKVKKKTTKKKAAKTVSVKATAAKEKKKRAEEEKPDRFYEAVGKRKTAIARVRIWTKGGKEFLVNKKTLAQYFPVSELQKIATSSLEKMKCVEKFKVSILIKGGGISSQAEAVRHGLAKTLVLFNPDFRKRLKKAGFLRRDARRRERKKPGLKRARRAPQWKKR